MGDILIRLLGAFLLGALAYFLAHLLLNDVFSTIIALIVAACVFFGYNAERPFWHR